MSQDRTLREAIETWMAQRHERNATALPFGPADLYEFLLHPAAHPRRAEIVQALGEDPRLGAMLNELAASQREAALRLAGWDIALPKAAAVAGEGTGRITTEGGKYTIEIRPRLDQVDRGLVVVRVAAAFRDQLEGETLVVQDSRGQVLVRGRVVDGEVSGELESLEGIDYGFVVRAVVSGASP
ncbi:MAG: hypothetical protein IT369_04555 [Candidatus Latescibacteria bacterium]|nr:hypothetical protein [Candidatus Latescibacterota bacterium]